MILDAVFNEEEAMKADFGVVKIIYSGDGEIEVPEEVIRKVANKSAEIVMIPGKQPVYSYIISCE